MNKVILIGRLANDPEAYTTQNGISRSTFRIAVQRRFANAQGVREADFIPVVVWRQQADFVNRYFSKGKWIAVEGSMQVRSFDAQDGQKRYVTEVIADNVEFVGAREDSPSRSYASDSGPTTPPPAPQQPAQPSMNEFTEVDDDELPF